MSNLQLASDIKANFLQKYRVNSNHLESSKHLLVTHNMPHMNYFVQDVVIPGVSMSPAMQVTPLVDIPRAGDKLVYDPLTVRVIIDEDLRVWEETYDWIRGLTFPEKDTEYARQKKLGVYADMSLLFLKNSNTDNLKMKFLKVFPTTLSAVNMSTTVDASTILTADISFTYDLFKFERE